jgi:3-hydroxyacyl-[acyl-carrier-protein] dehydratase
MIVEKTDILEYIPQRPPMVMIDNIIYCDEKKIISSLFIDPENIFCKNGYFREPGLIENIAQTAAAKIGYLTKIEEKEISVGYICSIKDLKIYFLPPANSEIETEIYVTNELMGFTIIYGKIFSDNKIVSECEMRIFAQNSLSNGY